MSDEIEEKRMPLLDHLVELRTRLIYSFAAFLIAFFACYAVSEQIFSFLVAPLAHLTEGEAGRRMIYTALHEAFFTYLKVSFFAAACVAFPVISIQIWQFIAPGLYKDEKSAFLPFLIATPVLFTIGAAMVYFLVIPLAWQFFLGFEHPGTDGSLPLVLEPKVDQYLSLVMRLIFAFGVCFELPVLMILLAKVGIVTSAGLAKKRKYAILIAFVVAAILTPPDVISQVLLAIPVAILYEISIIGARIVEKKRGYKADEFEDDDDEPESSSGTAT